MTDSPYVFDNSPLNEGFCNELVQARPVIERWERWNADLRSGKYRQVRSRLRDPGSGRCCLGVAGDQLVEDDAAYWQDFTRFVVRRDALDGTKYLPAAAWGSFFHADEYPDQQPYGMANDALGGRQLRFAQIADFNDEVIRRARLAQGEA